MGFGVTVVRTGAQSEASSGGSPLWGARGFPTVYPIIDTAHLARLGVSVTALAESISVADHIRIAQYRHKGRFTRERFEEAAEVCGILHRTKTLFVINDRADIAMALRADGLHVGQDDLPPSEVRRLIGETMLLGYSTHNSAQLSHEECQLADYVAIGPVFATGSKANPDPVVGLHGVAEARGLTAKPLVAIGGITLGNAADVLASGADCVATISGLSLGNVAHWKCLAR